MIGSEVYDFGVGSSGMGVIAGWIEIWPVGARPVSSFSRKTALTVEDRSAHCQIPSTQLLLRFRVRRVCGVAVLKIESGAPIIWLA